MVQQSARLASSFDNPMTHLRERFVQSEDCEVACEPLEACECKGC